jgi:serine/threonine-protein kinase
MADDASRRCPFCGIAVPAGGHSGCPGLFREVMSEGFAAPPADAAPTLNQYALVAVAGRGGMGEVWKAWDTKLERWVAIKFLLGASEADAARFQREARLAARLRHPNIAVVHEVGENAGRHFLVMDFIDGETLAAARLGVEPALRVLVAVARAVDAAHRAGIIHRDLKPQNILLNREGWPFVTDFGLAKPMAPGGTVSASNSVVGTPAYMPPEQAAGRLQEIDERSDVYSLGATFYRVLTGSDPFEAATALEVLRLVTEVEPRAPRERNPKLPAAVDTVLRKCLSKTKAERYPTALDLAEDVERILSGSRSAAGRRDA